MEARSGWNLNPEGELTFGSHCPNERGGGNGVLTPSGQEKDIIRSYELGCNSFFTKPSGLDQLTGLIRAIEKYWFETAVLPPKRE